MQRIRSHLSFANVMSIIAVFVALGGTSFAAVQLAKNSVGAKQIKKNAVTASEVKRNAVGASELRSNAVTQEDIAEDGVGGSELANGSVGSGEVTNNSLTAADIDGATLDAETGPDFFARVQANGTLQPNVAGFPSQVKGIVAANVVKGEAAAATGNYCFDLPVRPATAQVTLDNADAALADRNLVASIAIDRGEDLGDCPATHNDARVRIVNTDGDGASIQQDARFFVAFER